ncbi:Sec-independent protein translocase subunit TatA/TatB [Halobellus rufus]|uniref:Sec-independent protein translocase subunit TatA/TatB n=1 Tax=Halobellus rufus TaxID=1448860 RepID=UPI0006788145|nr:twin-arginine translocase TatA/TatE family subunit [Halobellus rufus]
MDTLLPAFVGIPGGPELLVILLLVVLLFGADKLPKLARSSGQAMGEFRRGRDEIEDELRGAAESTPTRAEAEPAE